MDFQHRAGGKTGMGGVASASDANRDRRERLRLLALETIDLNKDPYFMKNHLGSYECKLCLTLHNNEVWLKGTIFYILDYTYLKVFYLFKCLLAWLYEEIFLIFQGSYLAHTQGKKHQANLLVTLSRHF